MGSLRSLSHNSEARYLHLASLQTKQMAEVLERGLFEEYPNLWLDIKILSLDTLLLDWDFPVTPGYDIEDIERSVRAILRKDLHLFQRDVRIYTVVSKGTCVELVRGV